MKAIFKEVGKNPVLVELSNNDDIRYEEMKKGVNGFLEYCYYDIVAHNTELVVNEEGMYSEKQNFKASLYNTTFYGNVYLIKVDDNGYQIDCNEIDLETFKNWLTKMQPYKQDSFSLWCDTFFKEKEINLSTIVTLECENTSVITELNNIISLVKRTKEIQAVFKDNIILLDFKNASRKNFIDFIKKIGVVLYNTTSK